MSNGSITLTLGGLSVSTSHFLGDPFPRKKIEPVKPGLSALGSFISYGRFYEERHIWQFTGIFSNEEIDILDAMYFEHHELRRTFQPAQILLIDCTHPLRERAPRTRAIAPAPDNLTKAVGANHIAYFAQFYAWFDAEPQYQKLGTAHQQATLSLIEFSAKVAP